jgi:hypothetical protein
MEDSDLNGKLVYLTIYLEKWYKSRNPAFNVPITNRLAKVVKVFDWDTEEGKILLDAREKNGKWTKLEPKDFKFVLKIYYPELILKKSNKVTIEEVVPKLYPGTKNEMFKVIPEWMLKDIVKEEKNSFTIAKK